ncbi:magnesium transporter protein 1-like protein [Blastocystis sp. subtype 4]|uniref:magnesium transporter protein 1-like protein n=1 Tax=Blastocystis sp. subtype 4 TaxID=944170 RepID=UPI000711E405|nr:magnesium transporter protein 1-like protein [Blastocystis sp. subtype 4]KNB44956.1 magnesium transporter protein 1-like protein [Blastocystis sp. subtype 4]|eukprot:XP_014528391.1 magnesium transporter protein 1-like protein [Blastocystis sp. subtype 4]
MVNNIVNLNEDTYTTYFLQQTRDFDAFILYTTIGSRYSCRLCPATNKEFARVAKAFNSLKEPVERDVLFVRVTIDNSPRIFQYHDFQTAPIITYLPKDEIMGKKLNPDNDYNLDFPVRAESIASFVRSKIHVTINIYRFPWPQVIILCLFVFGLPLVAYIYLFRNQFVYSLLGNYRIYLVGSLIVYSVAVTGFAYDIINGPSLLDCDRSGCHIFLRQGQNQQTIAEGIVTGGLCIVSAILSEWND